MFWLDHSRTFTDLPWSHSCIVSVPEQIFLMFHSSMMSFESSPQHTTTTRFHAWAVQMITWLSPEFFRSCTFYLDMASIRPCFGSSEWPSGSGSCSCLKPSSSAIWSWKDFQWFWSFSIYLWWNPLFSSELSKLLKMIFSSLPQACLRDLQTIPLKGHDLRLSIFKYIIIYYID